ncbi:expressed unknown protein [Seminavis robusta]|uniref:Uncharacterized protein n=1 Tax=Seminavis robusta TaxID=568900 RepID=A0A9N8EHN4_9STRA|nr:expressed unknown protein [Seminavis robusta]|eukprot:Sro967_g225840.1 n/a (187) ;mRNA; f:17514-18074
MNIAAAAAADQWRTLVRLDPIDDIDNMSEEKRTVAICLETYDGKLRTYRGSATFDRYSDSASYRFFLSVWRVKDVKKANGDVVVEEMGDTVERFPLRLTTRFSWSTDANKVKGKETSGRWIKLSFDRDKEAQTPDSVKQIDLIVPKSKSSDKGKLLQLAVEAAKHTVEAHIASSKFEAELERQQRY